MNPAPFRSAREAFLRFPSRLVNFFFRFSENFFSASPEACRRREIRFYENFAPPVKTFFSFVTLSRRSLSVSTGEGGHYAGSPCSSSFLWKVFLFFLIEGGRGTLWLGAVSKKAWTS